MSGPDSTRPAPSRPFQFTLRQILLLTVVCGLLLALFLYWGPVGFLAVYAVVCLSAMIWGTFRASNFWSFVGYGMLFYGLYFACVALPSVGSGPPSRRSQCSNNLRQIALALQNYHDIRGSFPPALVADASGKPLYSWRVLILPFLERNDLYQAFNLNEPWDGPNNRKLHGQVLSVYSCPASHDTQSRGETNYVAVLGPHTMWPGTKANRLSDVTDDPVNTLLLVEVHHSGIHWMEPRDLHVTQMPPSVNAPRGMGISSLHRECAMAAFADGHTRALPGDLPPATLRALLTIAGGEKVEAP